MKGAEGAKGVKGVKGAKGACYYPFVIPISDLSDSILAAILCPVDKIENSLMIGNETHGNAVGDTQLVMCEDGYAFPDGKSFGQRSCVEREEEGIFRRGEWEPHLQNCVPQ